MLVEIYQNFTNKSGNIHDSMILDDEISVKHPPFLKKGKLFYGTPGRQTRVGYSPGAREPGSHEIFRLTRNVGRNSRVITNIYFPQQEMLCHSKKFLATRRFFGKGRNFLSLEEISCHRKKILVTGRNFLPKQEISCPRSLGEILCHNKSFFMLISIYFQKKFLVQDEISCRGRNFIQ